MVAYALIERGQLDEARVVAERGLTDALRTGLAPGDAHYVLARVHAASAKADPDRLDLARDQLRSAAEFRPDIGNYYARDPLFAELRRDRSLNSLKLLGLRRSQPRRTTPDGDGGGGGRPRPRPHRRSSDLADQ